MSNLLETVVDRAKAHIQQTLQRDLHSNYLYHNLEHTKKVVEAADNIGKRSNLQQTDHLLLLLAAWFHDTGYIESPTDHEDAGAAKASRFLLEQQLPEASVHLVQQAILDTKMPQAPACRLGAMLADADMYHLGSPTYFDAADKLRKEWELVGRATYSDLEWNRFTLQFLSAHQYHTEAARELFDTQKQHNIAELRRLAEG